MELISGTDKKLRVFETMKWNRYLTLLNLRSWENLNRPVTEQIYVHSKLLIADDRVAILGSANINDRSQLGDRDSELAVIVSGTVSTPAPVNGKKQHPVCAEIKALRSKLWSKLFALDVTDKKVKVQPATFLGSLIDQPASPETWKAIQKQAQKNSDAYREAFSFIPGDDISIWPTWKKDLKTDTVVSTGKKEKPMPFETEFWKKYKPNGMPREILGFITALPVNWTKNENNDSGFSKTILAQIQPNKQEGDYKAVAALNNNRVTENS